MIQNHVLQLVCLTGMEPPVAFDADAVRDEKIKVLRGIETFETPEQVARNVVLGQYTPPAASEAWTCRATSRRRTSRPVPHADLRGHAAQRPLLALGRRSVLHPLRQEDAQARDGESPSTSSPCRTRSSEKERPSRTC